MTEKRIGFLCVILILFALLVFSALPGLAETKKDTIVKGKDYILQADSDFDYSQVSLHTSFFYGAESLGKLHVIGNNEKETTYNGFTAYGMTGSVAFRYEYDGALRTNDNTKWHLENDGLRVIRGYDLGFLNNIASGCIMIEKSPDGKNWEKAIDPLKNYFDKAKSVSESQIYTISKSDYKNGMYYRVVVAYKVAKMTKDGFFSDENDRRKCAEVYEFYIASEKNYVTIRDMGNGSYLNDRSDTDTGFMICKNGSNARVTVQNRNTECKDYEYFVKPGEYNIDILTRLGKKYSYTVHVNGGLSIIPLDQMKIYTM